MDQIQVDLPEYNIESEPDYDTLGLVVDQKIEEHLPDGKYIVRAIGSSDHPQLTREELIEKITELGTDKYDPNRTAVANEDFQDYDYDIQAGTFEIKDGKIVEDQENECKTLFGTTIYNFYKNAPFDRGHSVRIDILLIYDPSKLEFAKKKSTIPDSFKKGLELYLYKFKEPANKKEALVSIVNIR
jgi:hypothetical protein